MTMEEMKSSYERRKNIPPTATTSGPTDAEMAAWTDLEWLRVLKPVALINGDEYEPDESDAEMLTRLRQAAMRAATARREAYRGSAPDGAVGLELEAGLKTQGVKDGESRLRRTTTSTLAYPLRTIGVLDPGGDPVFRANPNGQHCTMTLVGPSTAIAAAHCFYDPSMAAWLPTSGWAFGESYTTTSSYAYAPSTSTGCYYPVVTSGWVAGGSPTDDPTYDFSFIEFYDNHPSYTCGLQPGNTVGWMSMWDTITEQQVWDRAFRITGYPTTVPSGWSPYIWPSQFEDFRNAHNTYVPAGYATRLYYRMDSTGGQSGAAIRGGGGNDTSIIGVVKGDFAMPSDPDGFMNWGRRIDTTVSAFGLAWTAL